MQTNLPSRLKEAAAIAEREWKESTPLMLRLQVSLAEHVAGATFRYLQRLHSLPFDREAALERFRQIPMQHLENASFETFYINGALKQFEHDQGMVEAFLEGSAEWEDQARLAKKEVEDLKAAIRHQQQMWKDDMALARQNLSRQENDIDQLKADVSRWKNNYEMESRRGT